MAREFEQVRTMTVEELDRMRAWADAAAGHPTWSVAYAQDVPVLLDLLAAKDEEIAFWKETAGDLGGAVEDELAGREEAEARAERLEAERDRLLNSLHMQNQVTGLIPGALEAFRAVRYAAADRPAAEPKP